MFKTKLQLMFFLGLDNHERETFNQPAQFERFGEALFELMFGVFRRFELD